MPELRECPFCGGELTCVSGTGVDLMTQDNRPYIGCKVCEWTLSGRRLTEIAKIINYRPTEDRLREELNHKNRLIGAFLKRREALKATLSADPSTLENPSGTIEAAIDEIAALRKRMGELETKLRKIASDSILD